MEKIGAWAITEPGSGSDAFGSMRSTARRDGDEYVLNGSKTFITNGPYADTIVFICKLDEGNPPEERAVLSFVLDSGMPGLEQSKPLKKMGMHSSPTGELFLTDVRAGRDRLIGETEESEGGGRQAAKATFLQERAGVAAMALGIISQCLDLSVAYAKERVQFGKPIGRVPAHPGQARPHGGGPPQRGEPRVPGRSRRPPGPGGFTLAEASAMKLYAARAATEVALEAVQLFGGNGYMSEFQVEQLARDAKVLQIYAGTDEIQITHIARDLLSRWTWPHRVARGGRDRGGLGRAAPDDLLHDLRRAAVDAGDAGVGVGPGHRVLGHVAVAAVQLHAGVHHPALQLRAPPLGHGGLLGRQVAGVEGQHAAVDEALRHLDLGGHLGHAEPAVLERADGLAEGGPLLDVGQRRVEARPGRPPPPSPRSTAAPGAGW